MAYTPIRPILYIPVDIDSIYRGIFGLARKFKIIDDNNNGFLEIDEFKKAINEHALGWSEAVRTLTMIFA